MHLDLKIQGKSLKEMKRLSSLVNRQGKFHFTKMNFFTILQGHCPYVYRGVSWLPATKKLEFFLTLVKGWNLLPIVTESSTLDVVEVLDMPLVSDDYVCN